jgi:hypothetical protein
MQQMIANKAISANLFNRGPAIAAGEQVNVIREFYFNGENWVKLTNGFDYPSVFFDR